MEGTTQNVLYENTVLVNLKWFFGFRKSQPIKLEVRNKELILNTQPLITIPFIRIKSIKSNFWFSSAFRVNLTDGTVYKIVWASDNKSMRYSAMETADIFNNLKRIIK